MKPTKHYPIGQVCKITDLPHSTIRFWEKTFQGLKPTRSSGGHRYYSAQQVDLINALKNLLYDKGLTIEGAKKYLSTVKNGETEELEIMVGAGDDVKAQIKQELQAILAILNNN